METVCCKNCANEFSGNFCPECGQKAKTSKIDLKYLQEEAKYTLLHLNNGFFYTTKELFIRPGRTTREFIEGRRVNHYKPILYLFVLAGLYGFLLNAININAIQVMAPVGRETEEVQKALTWMAKHYSLAELLFLPLAALSSWLAFRIWNYNYIEHLIINAYAAGLRLSIQILFYPISLLAAGTIFSFIVSGILSTISILTTGWLFTQFFHDKPLDKVILRLLLLVLYTGILTLLLGMGIAVCFIINRQ